MVIDICKSIEIDKYSCLFQSDICAQVYDILNNTDDIEHEDVIPCLVPFCQDMIYNIDVILCEHNPYSINYGNKLNSQKHFWLKSFIERYYKEYGYHSLIRNFVIIYSIPHLYNVMDHVIVQEKDRILCHILAHKTLKKYISLHINTNSKSPIHEISDEMKCLSIEIMNSWYIAEYESRKFDKITLGNLKFLNDNATLKSINWIPISQIEQEPGLDSIYFCNIEQQNSKNTHIHKIIQIIALISLCEDRIEWIFERHCILEEFTRLLQLMIDMISFMGPLYNSMTKDKERNYFSDLVSLLLHIVKRCKTSSPDISLDSHRLEHELFAPLLSLERWK